MYVADGEILTAVDRPRLRVADRDRHVESHAFMGGDAAGGDGQRHR